MLFLLNITVCFSKFLPDSQIQFLKTDFVIINIASLRPTQNNSYDIIRGEVPFFINVSRLRD